MAFFEVFKSGRKSGDVQLEGDEVVIGRDQKAGLRLEDTTLSRQHARVYSDGAAWIIEDLHTRNGTWVNGVKEYRRILRDGDQLQLGKFVLTFRLQVGERPPPPPRKVMSRREREQAERAAKRNNEPLPPLEEDEEPTNVQKQRPTRPPVHAPDAPDSTRVVDPKLLAKVRRDNQLRMGPHLEPADPDAETVPLVKLPLRLGTRASADVKLDGSPRGNAEITADAAGFLLRRRGLFGTVKVNGRGARSHVLKAGDVVQVGPARFTFRLGSKKKPGA